MIVIFDAVATGTVILDITARINTEGNAADRPKYKEEHKAPDPLNTAGLPDGDSSCTLRAYRATRSPLVDIDVIHHLPRWLGHLR